MELDLLYYHDKVTTLNPTGNCALLTLWSKVDYVLEKLKPVPENLAAVSNFYGDGISQLLANLLNNPQLTDIFITGTNRAGSQEELEAFFEYGVEEVKINGVNQYRIRSTQQLLNAALAGGPDLFKTRPRLHYYRAIDDLRAAIGRVADNRHVASRVAVQLLEARVDTMPSVLGGHQVVSRTILDGWREALFLISRYGLITELAKGQRKELANLKVVITEPGWLEEDDYRAFGLDKVRLLKYAEDIVDPELPPDTTYTYGNRLRSYFGHDALAKVYTRLAADRADRKCFLTTWDQAKDMEDGRGHPCLVTLFFRVYNDQLTLTATFRTHRAHTAWVENAHGLFGIQQTMARRLGLGVGALTIISHSISIDPSQLPLVEGILAGRKWQMRDDGRGEVVFSLENGKAVAEHRMGGLTLKRYESSNVEGLSHRLAQDYLVSDLNHALYVGRQLGKLQMCLKYGIPYEES